MFALWNASDCLEPLRKCKGTLKTNNTSDGWHNRFGVVVGNNNPDLRSVLTEYRIESQEKMAVVASSCSRRDKYFCNVYSSRIFAVGFGQLDPGKCPVHLSRYLFHSTNRMRAEVKIVMLDVL